MCMCDDGNSVCFKRKSNICIAKFGNFGDNGVKGSKFLVENVIFGIADPDLQNSKSYRLVQGEILI